MARYDWLAIRLDYETGRFSFKALQEKYGPAKSTISRRAKSECWVKGALADKAAQAVTDMATNTMIGSLSLTSVEITERHKQEIESTRNLLGGLREAFENALKKGATKEIVTKNGRANIPYTINDLTLASVQFVKVLDAIQLIERRAYGLDIADKGDDDKTLIFDFEE